MSDSKNCLLVYKGVRAAESIRNALLLGVDNGTVKGFIEKKADKDDAEWKLFNAQSIYFEPAHADGAEPLGLKHHTSILRYVGRMTGLYPKDDPDAALIMDDCLDMLQTFRAKFKYVKEDTEADRILCETMLHFQGMISENAQKTGAKVVVGDSISIVDLELAAVVGWCGSETFVERGFFDRESFKEEFPMVREVRILVNEHPYLNAATMRHQVHYALCKAGESNHGEAHSYEYLQKYKAFRGN